MIPTVRASALSAWADCPRRGAARMFREEILAAGYALNQTPSGIGAAVGTSVHAAAAMTLREKAATGSLAPTSVITDCAVETLRAQSGDGVLYDRETPSVSVAEKQVVRMARSYQEIVAPRVEPRVIEERLEADTGLGLVLSGQPDVREPDGLRDLKGGKRLGNHNCQVGAYSMLSRSHGLNVQRARIDHVPRVAITKDQPPPVTHEVDLAVAETAAIGVLHSIAHCLNLFRCGDPERRMAPGDSNAFLANASSMLCSPKYCPAHSSGPNGWCREHSKENE